MSDLNSFIGFGTKLSRAGNDIAEIVSIKPPAMKRDTPDVTTMDSSTSFRQFIPGLADGGEVGITMKFYPGDTNGQYGLMQDLENSTKQTFIITLPDDLATWTFNGYVTSIDTDVPLDDAVGLEATIKVTGKPVFGMTASTGWSAFDLTGATALSVTPAISASQEYYTATFTTATSVQPKVTASSHTIRLFIDDEYVEDLTSGSDGSAIAFTAGQTKKLTFIVYEDAKQPYVYQVMVTRTT